MVERLRVGVITSPHGIRGEVKVYPTTDETGRFEEIKNVYLVGSKSEILTELEISRQSKNMLICKFKCINSPETAEAYRNFDIYVDRDSVSPLKENENYIGDLIGLRVINEDGEELGLAEDVFPTGANHVLEVKRKSGNNLLIPYISRCILDVNLNEGFIRVHLLDGLLEL